MDHTGEIWYRAFNLRPRAADLADASRGTCRTDIEHLLTHRAGDPDAVDGTDRDARADTFSKPGNNRGGFEGHLAAGGTASG